MPVCSSKVALGALFCCLTLALFAVTSQLTSYSNEIATLRSEIHQMNAKRLSLDKARSVVPHNINESEDAVADSHTENDFPKADARATDTVDTASGVTIDGVSSASASVSSTNLKDTDSIIRDNGQTQMSKDQNNNVDNDLEECRRAVQRFNPDADEIHGSNIAEATTNCSLCLRVDPDLHRACLAVAWREFADFFRRNNENVQTFSVGTDPIYRQAARTTWISGVDEVGTVLSNALDPYRINADVVESANWQVLSATLLKECSKAVLSGGVRPLAVVVGANEGYYSFAASAGGCRSMLFEPQGGCVPWLLLNTLRNKHDHTVDIRVNAVSSDPITVDTMNSCDGGARYSADGEKTGNIDHDRPQVDPKDTAKMIVNSVRLDDVIHEDVQFLMIDVEGAEVTVLESARGLLQQHKVHHAVIEWMPDRFQHYGVEPSDGASRGAAMAQLAMWECRRLNWGTEEEGAHGMNERDRDSLDVSAMFARCLPDLTSLFNITREEDIYCRRMVDVQDWASVCPDDPHFSAATTKHST